MIVSVVCVALVLAIFTMGLRWLRYPHVSVRVLNETSTPIYDVHIKFLFGERNCERIDPGGLADTEIQSGGSASVFLSYRDSEGIVREDELYNSGEMDSLDRGLLEVHVTNEGIRLVNEIYTAVDIPLLNIHVNRMGQMTVKRGKVGHNRVSRN